MAAPYASTNWVTSSLGRQDDDPSCVEAGRVRVLDAGRRAVHRREATNRSILEAVGGRRATRRQEGVTSPHVAPRIGRPLSFATPDATETADGSDCRMRCTSDGRRSIASMRCRTVAGSLGAEGRPCP